MTDKIAELLKTREDLTTEIQKLLKKEVEECKHKEVDINDMSVELWNSMSEEEHRAWNNFWRSKGIVSFCCLTCGFPTVTGQKGCVACSKPIPSVDR